MKAMSKLVVTMLLLGLVCLWSSSARSDTLTSISWSDFLGLADITSPKADPLFDVYRFGDAWVEGAIHGTVYSQVFPGIGTAEGLYVYVYQINHKPLPEEPPPYKQYPFGTISFRTLTNIPPQTVGTVEYFVIDSGNPTIGFSELGVRGPTSDQFNPLGPIGQVSFTFSPKLDYNTTSYIFGFFHPLPPTTVIANLVDSEPEKLNPLVYTPSPEPSSIALLGLGLLGIFLPRRFKKKSL